MPRMTLAEYQAYEARQRIQQGRPAPAGGGAAEKEAKLHQEIMDYCRGQGWICLHGSMAHRAFRTIGEWDCTVIADGGRVFFIEAKTRTGKLTAEQANLHAWARRLGHEVHLVRCMNDFIMAVTPKRTPPARPGGLAGAITS